MDDDDSIQFGGVQLTRGQVAQRQAQVGNRVTANVPKPRWLDGQPGPAGEGSPMARIVTVSRWSLAARIKHGVPMSEVLNQLQTLALAEAQLLSEQEHERPCPSCDEQQR